MTPTLSCLRRIAGSRLVRLAACAGLALGAGGVAKAAPFLPSYTGPAAPSLALLSAGVTFDGVNFAFTSTSADLIGNAPLGSVFVWGVNRGAGIARFNTATPTPTNPAIGSNVLFDAVLSINPVGAEVVNLLNGSAPVDVSADVSISGATITALIPAALLPSTGFTAANYGFDLWPRSGAGLTSQISQFYGVTNSTNPVDAQATFVPEPSSLAILALGVMAVLVAGVRTRRPSQALPA